MPDTTHQGAEGADTMTGTLWCMHISGPDDVHAAPDFWTALSWAAELNAAVAARAIKQGWAGDDNWPLAQATVQRWPWSAERHADSLATELAARASQKAALASPSADAPGDF
ncbi:hypothetical protein AX289_32135 [Methylorubrum populi]|nr:hypothetical protein AX289_32135 [Methylorubrum populi]